MGKRKQSEKLTGYFRGKEKEFEDLCSRCGACCGAYDGDPCAHLRNDGKSKYYCDIYSHRLGKRKTVSGEEFECVPIREILNRSWPGSSRCVYKRLRRKPLRGSGLLKRGKRNNP